MAPSWPFAPMWFLAATFSPRIRRLATGFLQQPVQLQASPENQAAPTIEAVPHPCDGPCKPALLNHLNRRASTSTSCPTW